MATCEVTGKSVQFGHNVSHAHNITNRQFKVNVHRRRFWVPSWKRFVKLNVSRKGLRIIDRDGIEAVLVRLGKMKKPAKAK